MDMAWMEREVDRRHEDRYHSIPIEIWHERLVEELQELLPGLDIRGWEGPTVSIEGSCLDEEQSMRLIVFLRALLPDRQLPEGSAGARYYHNPSGWRPVLRYACELAGLPRLY